MKSLLDILRSAEERGVAVGHFNFSNLEQFWAIVGAAERLKAPVVLGLSEGEREFVGLDAAAALVCMLRERRGLPVFLNADHTYSLEKVREAAEAGCDAVIFDGAKLSFDENVAQTREAMRIARKARRRILIEGELGYIGQSSQVLMEVPAGAAITEESLTLPEQAARFVKETKVDLFAPAVGNVHGIVVAPGFTERLFIDRIRAIRAAVKVPLVLHGGSGLAADDFRAGIQAGISLIHISTELRRAWRADVEDSLRGMPHELAPYKILKKSVGGVGAVVEEKIKLFREVIK